MLQPTPMDSLGLMMVQWPCVAAVLGFGYQLVLNRMGESCVCDVLPSSRREEVVA